MIIIPIKIKVNSINKMIQLNKFRRKMKLITFKKVIKIKIKMIYNL